MAFDNVQRHFLFPEDIVMDTTAAKSGPITQSIARRQCQGQTYCHSRISQSVRNQDNCHMHWRQVRLMAYGASKSPAASNEFQLAKMSSDVIAPLSKNIPVTTQVKRLLEQSWSTRTSAVLPLFGVCFKLNTKLKASRVTAASAYIFTLTDDDMPALRHSSSDEGGT